MTASHNGPPDKLDRLLEVGPSDWTQLEFHQLISTLVFPRPIGRVDPRLLDPVGRLAGSGYATLGELLNLPQVPWSDLKMGLEKIETLSTWRSEALKDGSQA